MLVIKVNGTVTGEWWGKGWYGNHYSDNTVMSRIPGFNAEGKNTSVLHDYTIRDHVRNCGYGTPRYFFTVEEFIRHISVTGDRIEVYCIGL